jgi:hypothetical protein
VSGYFGAPAHLKTTYGDSPSAQERCDAIQAEFRSQHPERASIRREPQPRRSIRREPPPTPKALVPTDNLLKLRMAEELEYARRMLDLMGEELSGDHIVVSRHVASLQTVDIAGQILGQFATLIRSSDPEGAVDLLGMAELKTRLQRKPNLL